MNFAGFLTKVSSTGKIFQIKSFFKGEEKVPNITNYGFFSVPPLNSKLVIIQDFTGNHYSIGWQDSNNNPLVENLKSSEAIAGNFVKESIIKFDENGNIDITCNGNKTVTITGNCTINVTGDASITADNVNVTATTKATVTAPISEVNSAISSTITSPISTIISTTSATVTTPIAKINSALIDLGTGATLGVARLGDTVDLTPASPTYGKIITASTNTRSI